MKSDHLAGTVAAMLMVAAPACAQSSGNAGGLLGGSQGGASSQASQSGKNATRTSGIGDNLRMNDSHIGGISIDPQLSYATSSARRQVQLGDAAGGAGVNVAVGSGSKTSAQQNSRSGSVSLPVQFDGATLGGGALGLSRNDGRSSAATSASRSTKR